MKQLDRQGKPGSMEQQLVLRCQPNTWASRVQQHPAAALPPSPAAGVDVGAHSALSSHAARLLVSRGQALLAQEVSGGLNVAAALCGRGGWGRREGSVVRSGRRAGRAGPSRGPRRGRNQLCFAMRRAALPGLPCTAAVELSTHPPAPSCSPSCPRRSSHAAPSPAWGRSATEKEGHTSRGSHL